ncbi:MAG: ATP-binding protein [Lachnospiraceae bacterium]|nr:ATP-binding protein [Lachnospiraceae bacterium]
MKFSFSQGVLLFLAVLSHAAFLACFWLGVDAGILSTEISCGVFFLLILLLSAIYAKEEEITIEEYDDSHRRSHIHVDKLIEQLADRREKLEKAESKIEDLGNRMVAMEQENVYYKEKSQALLDELDEIEKQKKLEEEEKAGAANSVNHAHRSLLPAVEDQTGETINLALLIEDCLFRRQEELEEAGIQAQVIAPEEELFFAGDKALLETALFHIFDNSIKYMKRPGLLQITLSALEKDLFLVIKDDGEGLPSEEVNRLFELNFQGSNRRGGGGLGLSQVEAIVEHYGGKVYARSEKGQGFGIYIRLPR